MSTFSLLQSSADVLLPMENRSPGAHISVILHYLCLFRGLYTEQTEADISRMQLGCALEHAIAHRYSLTHPDRYIQPGELELDSLYGTPDLYDLLIRAVIEIKLTWMSARHDIASDKFWRYWVQLMAYCHMMSTKVGFLHVVHVNGGYDKDIRKRKVVYNVWQAEFTKSELSRNWRMLKNNEELAYAA